MQYCECGCGEELDFTKGRKNKKYKQGHATRIANKGAIARKDSLPWNKGVPRTESEKKNISAAIKIGKANSTYVHTEDHRRKMSESLRGNNVAAWSHKITESRTNGPNYEKWKINISNTLKLKYKRGELVSPWYVDGRYKNDPNSNYNKYGGKFTEELKYEIRKRDAWICQLCGKTRSADVHHIDWDKMNNNTDNLIVLCRGCHSKHHHKSKKDIENEREVFIEIVNGKLK
jgi:hypothetical protein